MDQQKIISVIERIRREDSDFLTVDTIQTYTGCTAAEARAALNAVFGNAPTELARAIADAEEAINSGIIIAGGERNEQALRALHSARSALRTGLGEGAS